MIYFILSSSVFLLLYILIKLLRRNFRNQKIGRLNKKNLYVWMQLSKKERYNLTNRNSTTYFNKRKDLLDQIRKEYKVIKKLKKNN